MGIQQVNKRWRVDWRDEYEERHRRSFASKTAASDFLKKELARVLEAKGKLIPERITFKSYCERWLKKVKADCEARNKPSTHEFYKGTIDKYLTPFLGDRELSKLTPSILRELPEKFRDATYKRSPKSDKEEHLKPKTIRNHLTTLGTILRDAYKDERIARDLSPFLAMPKITARVDNKRPFTQNEVALFFKHCPVEFRLFYLISFFTGMRTGEVIGLRFGDVDLVSNKIHVEQAKTRGNITTPKTGARVVDITPHLRPHFHNWRHLKDVKGDMIFPGLNAHNLRNRVWVPIVRKMKVAYRKPYVTRHTFASLMLAEGQPPTWVAWMMGDNLETVLRNYAQYIPTNYREKLLLPILDGHFLDTCGEAKNNLSASG